MSFRKFLNENKVKDTLFKEFLKTRKEHYEVIEDYEEWKGICDANDLKIFNIPNKADHYKICRADTTVVGYWMHKMDNVRNINKGLIYTQYIKNK